MGLFGDMTSSVKSINISKNFFRHVTFVFGVVTSGFLIRKVLTLITGTKYPVVLILSGSMEPGITRGDILFLHMNNDPIRAGEIILFKLKENEFLILHRVIKVHERRESGEIYILTKGDDNAKDDLEGMVYPPGQKWLERRHIIGRAFGILPYVGWLVIPILEMRKIKYIKGLEVFVSKEKKTTGSEV